ncbi:MAG: hypothetical protein MUC84_00865 [Solirubrobacteraceae bacterium]|nr:hypothetical protein [Solirubrobacteraceae bacterium]MCU0312597.1 hypothetical protein [Solirubrobacteraceae bacterium]
MSQVHAPVRPPAAPAELDEHAARALLRAQVARLERRLSAAVAASMPDGGLKTSVPRPAGPGGPRLLSLGELEVLRDALAGRAAEAERALAEREREREDARVRLERMLLAPGEHRRVRITQRELGEGGCGVWHVRPRLGLVGMLMGWWQVKLSSGCPLPGSR